MRSQFKVDERIAKINRGAPRMEGPAIISHTKVDLGRNAKGNGSAKNSKGFLLKEYETVR